ncbi:PLD nuclease N-terminal domain-containing protein [Salininema proteolyticum]|uniref:PLD nuclease N-terminal domain-containing protein n=1 Tax=Salininema proteolyticum TaxID=1607685 RepID=A0ABV8U1F6_9ACTN
MVRVLIFTFLAYLALVIAALADCLGSEEDPRRLGKGAWSAVILLLPIAGAILWFWLGRPAKPEGPGGPARPQGGSTGPIAPDDDPDFLRDLDKRLRDRDDKKRDD